MDNLLELDPDLILSARPDELVDIPDVIPVRCVRVPVGTWDPSSLADAAYFGVLIVSGRLAGTVGAETRRHVEILGPGDVGQPWVDDVFAAAIPYPPEWRVLQELDVAILDARFAAVTSRWPVITRALMERLVQRSRRLVFQLAVMSVPQIARRVELIMRHFAERWGRVTPDGIVLELPLSHELLAQVVSSHRPSVTTALSELRRAGRLARRDDGCWMLPLERPSLADEPGVLRDPLLTA